MPVRGAAVLFMLCVAACGGDEVGFGVATTALFDGTVDDATVGRVSSLEIVATGDESYTQPLPLGRAARRTERFVYRPLPTTRSLQLTIYALDDQATVLAVGASPLIALADGKTTIANVTLDTLAVPDGGVDFAMSPDDLAGVDLSGADLSSPPDLATPPSKCPLYAGSTISGVIACAGYEDDADQLSVQTMNGTSTLDSTRAYRGKHSLHLLTNTLANGDTKAVEQLRGGLSLVSSTYASRAFYYMTAAPPAPTRFMDLQQGGSPYDEILIGIDTAGRLARLIGVPPMVAALSATSMPLGRWVCIEMRITLGGASTGAVHYFLDGTELTDLAYAGNTLDTPSFDTAIFGMRFGVSPAQSWEYWLDEVMIATQAIGCDK